MKHGIYHTVKGYEIWDKGIFLVTKSSLTMAILEANERGLPMNLKTESEEKTK